MKILAIATTLLATSTAVISVAFWVARDNQRDLVIENQKLLKELTQHENASSDAKSFIRWYDATSKQGVLMDSEDLNANIQTLRNSFIHYYPDNKDWEVGETEITWNVRSE